MCQVLILLLQMDSYNSMNAICKSTGKRWRIGGRQKSEAAHFLLHLIVRFNNTVLPPGRLETLMTDHGGEVLSTSFTLWPKQRGVFHLTGARKEPNYNAVIERASEVLENMAFAMITLRNPSSCGIMRSIGLSIF